MTERGMSALRRRLSRRDGFTISEVLVAMLIMLLMGGVMTQTVSLAQAQVDERQRDSDGQLLCSALCTKVQTILTYANEISETDGTFCDQSLGANGLGNGCKLMAKAAKDVSLYEDTVSDPNLKILVLEYEKPGATGSVKDYYPLVDLAMYEQRTTKGATSTTTKANLSADIKYEWDKTAKVFEVTVTVNDTTKGATREVCKTEFKVRPISVL